MRRLASVLLLAGVSVVALAPAAGAHAGLVASDPAAGAQLAAAPEAVVLDFTEEPERSLSVIRVLDTSGGAWEQGKAAPLAGEPKKLRIALKALPEGVYTVSWRVVSQVDGHATAGAFAFGVGVAASAAPPPSTITTPPPSKLEMTGRWGIYIGLAGIIGIAWVSFAVFGKMPHLVYRLGLGSWVVAVAGLVVLAEAQRRAADVSLGGLLPTTTGRALIWRAVALLVAGTAIAVAPRTIRRMHVIWLGIASVAGAGAALAHVSAGHSAAQSFAFGAIAGQWVHVVAASVWIGGLAALLIGTRGATTGERGAAFRRFSTVAGFAIVLVLGTGVFRSLMELDRVSNLWDSGYGRIVAVKSGLFLLIAVMGARNRYRHLPKVETDPRPIRRTSRWEVVVALVAFGAAAALASFSPPAPKAEASAAQGLTASAQDFGTTVRVRLDVTPGVAGANRFVLQIRDYDSGDPVAAQRVMLRFTYLDASGVGQSTLDLERIGEGRYGADGSNLSLAGRWQVAAVIERGAASVEVEMTVATKCGDKALAAEGQPTIHTIDLPGVGSVQGYLDPGRAGSNDVHVTFFDPSGAELPIAGEVTLRASAGEQATPFTVRRFGPGHFVADAELTARTWRFDFAASTPDGGSIRGCFNETVAD